MTNEERMEILQKIETGEVSVQDALGMMSPVATPAPIPSTPQQSETADSQRWLRVRVTNMSTGKRKVSVNVPLGLMKWGLALGSRYAPELNDVDWNEIVTELDRHADGFLVEVEDDEDNERVEVFIE
jgi:hypothetical protein